ncbi:mandelate racemase/muconate lactonizing enzyme family protein [Enterocloster aldenensis]|uniref:mandelate racemase/muconate lactonizing enzyme family protein n=1 Tax=Enterocloster aldenensis TaxID=358742 RepID=UPI00402957A2
MKITKVELLMTKQVYAPFQLLFCRVYTDEGIYGDGESGLGFGGAQDAAFGMMKDLAKLIIGMDPLQHEVIWQKMYKGMYWGRNGGAIAFGGISAIDIALWDIKGKKYHAPVHELLGGKSRSTLRAYASQLQNGWGTDRKPARTPKEYADVARIAVEQGFDCIKTDFFMFKEEDGRFLDTEQNGLLPPKTMRMLEARIAATREAVGPDVDIIMENHCYTDALGAVQMGNMANKYGILYFEEPTTPHEEINRYVHDKTGIPVATGERLFSRWQFKKMLDAGAVQIIQPDIGTAGGITETKKICDMAYVYDAGVQIHVCGSMLITGATLQLEAAIPGFVIHEHNINCILPEMLKLTKYSYEPVNGCFTVPDQPGIGNEISEYAYEISTVVAVE